MLSLLYRSLFLGITFIAFASAAISETGKTLIVNGIRYYASVDIIATIPVTVKQLRGLSVNEADLVPITVLEQTSSSLNATALQNIVTHYTAIDDVFNAGFLQVIYLKQTSTCDVSSLGSALTAYGTQLFLKGDSVNIPTGPYFMDVTTGDVVQAYRLYSDVQQAFTEGLIAQKNGTFDVLPAAVQGAQQPTIGVPSRIYYTKTDAQPLAGVRLGIKDIYDIAGVKTSCGNRAFYDLYPERNVTAIPVQRLIDAGAIIVGKMKTSQFANGETATADWVDYHSPFNARGDGYQDPSSSSSGPGAGIGSYQWLDLTLGSDTGGSIRNPSQVNGAFGNRPSHGLVPLDGVMPLSPPLDTAGFICRDATLWKATALALYQDNITIWNEFPKKIYTSGFPINATTEAEAVLLAFLAKLQAFLSANVTVFDYNTAWAATGPVTANLSTYLNLVYPTLISQQQYQLVTLPFYADYAKANNGRRPFIDPSPLIRWTWGQKNISANATTTALQQKNMFMNWWNTEVQVRDNKTCSDSLMLYPGALATPTYRNIYRSAPGIPTGFGVSRISNFAEIPDMVLPIGQAAYNSTITLQSEYLPVAVDIMAAKGCDGMIFELAERLQMAGIISPVGTGSTMYAGMDKIYM